VFVYMNMSLTLRNANSIVWRKIFQSVARDMATIFTLWCRSLNKSTAFTVVFFLSWRVPFCSYVVDSRLAAAISAHV
jgi:hypothetical protein